MVTSAMASAMFPTARSSGSADPRSGTIVTHPNRDKPVVQATRATVVLLLLASAALILIVMIGGWSLLDGMIPIQMAWIAAYLVLAFTAARWNRGALPIAAVLAVLMGIFALVAGPSWFARDKTGFAEATINSNLLGLLTLLIVPVQMLLVAFAMRGFKQGWNVELERRDPAALPGDYPDAPPYPA
jgi:presenilin-like A22 family membrane protease